MVISHLKELIEIVANSSGGYSTTKDVSASITMGHVVDLLSAEACHPTVRVGRPPGHCGSGEQTYEPLHSDSADPIGFL